jgi:hypothetical protein
MERIIPKARYLDVSTSDVTAMINFQNASYKIVIERSAFVAGSGDTKLKLYVNGELIIEYYFFEGLHVEFFMERLNEDLMKLLFDETFEMNENPFDGGFFYISDGIVFYNIDGLYKSMRNRYEKTFLF